MTLLTCSFVLVLISQALLALLTIASSDETSINGYVIWKLVTKALRHQLEFIEEDNVLLMLGMYFISILKKLSFYVSNLNIK
jgi:hypothetical protein